MTTLHMLITFNLQSPEGDASQSWQTPSKMVSTLAWLYWEPSLVTWDVKSRVDIPEDTKAQEILPKQTEVLPSSPSARTVYGLSSSPP